MNIQNQKLQQTYALVCKILKENIDSRDDDLLLIRLVYERLDASFHTDFGIVLEMIRAKMLPSFETVRRSRQKAQEKHREYRGEKWIKRHYHSQNVKAEIQEL